MSIHLHFDRHITDATKALHEAHCGALRAAQCHDEDVITLVLREVVHHIATAREQIDTLANVKRPSHGCPVSG